MRQRVAIGLTATVLAGGAATSEAIGQTPVVPGTTTPAVTTPGEPDAPSVAGVGQQGESGSAIRHSAQKRPVEIIRAPTAKQSGADQSDHKPDAPDADAPKPTADKQYADHDHTTDEHKSDDDAAEAAPPPADAGALAPVTGASDALPGLTPSLPSLAPAGLPGFFIPRLRIPPFLLPIYQAAGLRYGVRWEVLAAINEIETDYGHNLSLSSAGAEGWMQFMPDTWRRWGVDANGDGTRDPMNPVDAIFTAARYLRAGGAATSLHRAIFAYNHASWYVDSVLLRARLVAGLPEDLVGSLSGLTAGRFPVAAHATYDGGSDATAPRPPADQPTAGTTAPAPTDAAEPTHRWVDIHAAAGSPVIAIQDGHVVGRGHTRELGDFVRLRDVDGTTYSYSHLGSLAARTRLVDDAHALVAKADREQGGAAGKTSTHPTTTVHHAAPAPTTHATRERAAFTPAGRIAPRRVVRIVPPPVARPAAAATHQPGGAIVAAVPTSSQVMANMRAATAAGTRPATPRTSARLVASPAVTARLRALSFAPATLRAGALGEVAPAAPVAAPVDVHTYEPVARHASARDVATTPNRRLRVGTTVGAGTILGRLGSGTSPSVRLRVRPAGHDAPELDPRPLLDGWRALDAATTTSGGDADSVLQAGDPGRVLLQTRAQLARRVLDDNAIHIYPCGRADIRAGHIDRRILATLEYLRLSGLHPTVSALECGHAERTTAGNVSEHTTGDAVDIAAINGIPILGHQGPGTITDVAVRRLLRLQGAMRPHQIITLHAYPGATNTLALPDHDDHIHVGFRPAGAPTPGGGVLRPGQWDALMQRLETLGDPPVSTRASRFAIPETHKP